MAHRLRPKGHVVRRTIEVDPSSVVDGGDNDALIAAHIAPMSLARSRAKGATYTIVRHDGRAYILDTVLGAVCPSCGACLPGTRRGVRFKTHVAACDTKKIDEGHGVSPS